MDQARARDHGAVARPGRDTRTTTHEPQRHPRRCVAPHAVPATPRATRRLPFTVAEAAEYLNVGQRYVRWLRETGRIPVLKYGGGPTGRIRVFKRHLDDFMADAEECGAQRGREWAPRSRPVR